MYHMAMIYAICVIFVYLSFIPQELRNPVACDNPPIRGPASSAATWRFLARDLSNVHICSSSFQTYPGESSFQLHKKMFWELWLESCVFVSERRNISCKMNT